MTKKRIVSLFAALVMALPLVASAFTVPTLAQPAVFDAVDEPMPEGNLVPDWSFDDSDSVNGWAYKRQKLTCHQTATGGYLHMSNIATPGDGFTYNLENYRISKGIYRFTGYFRMAYEGELTELRILVDDVAGNVFTGYVYPTSTEWLKVEFYITLERALTSVKVLGTSYIQQYCIDNFSLVKVDSIPDDYKRLYSFGKTASEFKIKMAENGSSMTFDAWSEEEQSKYDLKGVIINRDIDFIGTCNANTTREDLENYVYSHEGSQITDFMINVFCQVATYPSEVATDFIDQYHYAQEHGTIPTNNQKIAQIMYEKLDLDYVKVFCETFPKIGINPWISLRMNDAHGMDTPESKKDMPFYYDNPQIRRVQHGSTTNRYYDNLMDYTHDMVREYMLSLVNEVLGRYDCYGLELDFQRDIWIWHTGGEYPGLDILTDFMREVDRIVKIYEDKYNHDIKVAVRCSTDIQSNYDFGYDVITWAAEGLVDLYNPTARWATTEFDIPVKSWVSIMHPFGVEVAPGLEQLVQISPSGAQSKHDFETVCALSASWYSQGADKVYFYNYFLGLNGAISEENKITTDSNVLAIHHGKGYWNVITTAGSYEKSLERNRRMIITHNDMKETWQHFNAQLPKGIKANSTETLHIQFGDVPEGATVTFSINLNERNIETPPTVYINGREAKFVDYAMCIDPVLSTDTLACYEVPKEAWDDMYLTVQITPEAYLTVNYAEVYVKVTE